MRNRKAAAVIALALAASLTFGACGANKLNPKEVAATVGDNEISLGVANFAATLTQAQYETYYKGFLGENMWDQVLGEVRYEDQVKNSIMDNLKQYYLAEDHAEEYGVSLSDEDLAKIADTAAAFMKDNNKKAIDQMTASEETIKEFLSALTIQNRVYTEVVKGADTDIPEEDCIQKRVNFVFVSTAPHENEDGETVEYTDAEKAEREAMAKEIAEKAKAGEDFETVITDAELSMSTGTFGKDYEGGVNEAVRNAAETMKEGEISDVLPIDNGFYVAQLVTNNDEEATASRRQVLVNMAEQNFYDEVSAKWEEEAPFTLNEDVWSKVTFAAPLTIESAQ